MAPKSPEEDQAENKIFYANLGGFLQRHVYSSAQDSDNMTDLDL